ncbi:hypothetical protein JQX13_16715 [Archangium violaceum]|uniref:hypothetical protein n=1 Tax=Archangium violaceum TaxID=83451 RepID=UPI00193B2C78|nr:hypothetical protein [Archangium violaceum]QRK11566.1 hypothetical protein JQX13_16715 [Archangium violaceum]
MIITRSDVSSGVWLEELDEEGQKVDGHLTTLTWTQEGGGTKVTWMYEGLLRPVIGGYFVWAMNDMMDIYFEQGLKNLKAQVEKRRAAELEAAQPPPCGETPRPTRLTPVGRGLSRLSRTSAGSCCPRRCPSCRSPARAGWPAHPG